MDPVKAAAIQSAGHTDECLRRDKGVIRLDRSSKADISTLHGTGVYCGNLCIVNFKCVQVFFVLQMFHGLALLTRSGPAFEVTDVGINATCKVTWCVCPYQVALIAASVTPMAAVLVLPDLVSGGSGSSCMLLAQPTPTGTNAGPDLLQLALVMFFCPLSGANTPLTNTMMITQCKLHLWCFIH